jgi:hypothetical protein
VPIDSVGARVKNGPALAGHGAEAVRESIADTIVSLPEQLRLSLTWDQGRVSSWWNSTTIAKRADETSPKFAVPVPETQIEPLRYGLVTSLRRSRQLVTLENLGEFDLED